MIFVRVIASALAVGKKSMVLGRLFLSRRLATNLWRAGLGRRLKSQKHEFESGLATRNSGKFRDRKSRINLARRTPLQISKTDFGTRRGPSADELGS